MDKARDVAVLVGSLRKESFNRKMANALAAHRRPVGRVQRRELGLQRDDPLVRRYRYAEPRLALGRALRGLATAAMDVSDGLLGDLEKLCAASGVAAQVDLDRLPISPALAARFDRAACERYVLHGGDDYELLFTFPPDRAASLPADLHAAEAVTCKLRKPVVAVTN